MLFSVLSSCRVLMVTINDDLDTEDLEQMKFVLSRNISREKIKHCKVRESFWPTFALRLNVWVALLHKLSL